jgi:hypothetical protein
MPITAVRADLDREVNPAVAAAMSTAKPMVTSKVTDMRPSLSQLASTLRVAITVRTASSVQAAVK